MSGRISVEEHEAAVRALLRTMPHRNPELVPLRDAVGRVTALPITSPVDLPLFRNSQMDGFAVVAADLGSVPATLPVVGEIAARKLTPPPLQPGTAVRIMTGAVVPDGADAVVPVEDTTVDPGSGHVTISRARDPGEYVREPGSDLKRADQLLPAGVRLASRHVAALAAAGLAEVEVVPRVRTVIVTTGAELVEPGSPATLGEVYDSNGIALETAALAAGGEVTRVIRIDSDDARQLRSALDDAVPDADLIVTSGGISMGNFEVVRDLLGTLDAWVGTVAMQPGGPQATGTFAGIPLVAFPGNPVSSQISFEIFVAPVLRERSGLRPAGRQRLPVARDLTSLPGRRQFLRGLRLPDGGVDVTSGPGSHLVVGLARADVLIDVPADVTGVQAGDLVEVLEL